MTGMGGDFSGSDRDEYKGIKKKKNRYRFDFLGKDDNSKLSKDNLRSEGTKRVIQNFNELIEAGTRFLNSQKREIPIDKKEHKDIKFNNSKEDFELERINQTQNKLEKILELRNPKTDFSREIDENTRDLRFERIKNIRNVIKKELTESVKIIVSSDWAKFRTDSVLIKSGVIPKNQPEFFEKQKSMNKNGFIYLIQNQINGKVYVGQTTKNLKQRFNEHKRVIPQRYRPINRAIKKYGNDNFLISQELKINNSPQYMLDFYEKYFIKKYQSNIGQFGYNCTDGGFGGRPNEETKRKISETLMGRPGSMKGKIFSDEHRNRISEALKGKPKSDETRRKISNSLMGNIVSLEARKKIADAIRGEKHYFYGQHMSDEQKQKMVDSKRENFIQKYNLNEHDFINAINENTTLKELQESFNLPDHAVRNALKWTMGSRSLRHVKKNLQNLRSQRN